MTDKRSTEYGLPEYRSKEGLAPGIGGQDGPGLDCPSATLLATYLDGTLERVAQAHVEDHLSRCPHCRMTLGHALRMAAAPPDPAPAPELWLARARRLVSRPKAPRAPVWTAAAVVLLAVGLVTLLREPVPLDSPDAGWRETRQSRLVPGQPQQPQITAPLESAEIAANALAVRWSAVPGANAYVVRIVEEDGDLVLEERVGPATEWAPAAPLDLAAGAHYFVRVDAYTDGAKAQSSPHVLFTIAE